MNMFDGTIPTTFTKGNTLRNINLNGNRLKGSLPRALLNWRNLEILDLGNNMINDTYPQCLLPTQYFENFLAMMHVGYINKLKYMGDECFPYYTNLVVMTMKGFDIELEHILNIFTTIDFSKNNFAGEIPKSIGNLKSLEGLNLSHNKLCGHIPTSLRNLSNLGWLDLSSNNFYSEIPMQLSKMTSLAVLNLLQNHLVGAIHSGNQFNTFWNDSYIGNLGLCGFPLMKTCGNDQAQLPSSSVDDDEEATNGFQWKHVYMGYASGLVIGISMVGRVRQNYPESLLVGVNLQSIKRHLSRDENVRARVRRLEVVSCWYSEEFRKDITEMRLKATKRIAGYASSLFSLGMLFALGPKGMCAS
ncbi:hypothetical protein FNV43_RR21838 [Rhamnella rubrinervis]|uniref:Uncharacterized protein n=1 Tax=Rhamnella rubrinervis TaxID=2594499 RepID=A0A8K0DT62_9ROSA|nr:hypothetical protein FNV43_RR21838 [Rhamnella rubrinervis]